MAPYSPFNSARLQAMALAQAGMKTPAAAPAAPAPPRMPATKPFVAPVTTSTSQYDQAKTLYDQQVAAALAQHQAQLAAADRSGVPYQSLAESAKSLPGQITAGYDAAAGRSEAFTSAYSQAFRDHSAKLQAESGGAENRGSGLGDALAFMGSLPASGYRDSGSGLADAARFLPTTVGLRGLDAVATAKALENTAYAKLLSDLGVSGGKSLFDASQQDRTFGLDQGKFSYQQWKDAQAANSDKSKEEYKRWKDGQTLGLQKDTAIIARERLNIAKTDSVERQRVAREKATGYQVTFDDQGNLVFATNDAGEKVLTQAAADDAARRALTATSNDLRRLGLQQSSLAQAQQNSLYYLSMDKNGNISLYLDPKTKKPVLTKSGILRQDSLNVQDRIRSSESFSRAMSLASAMSSQYGLVSFPTLDKEGKWVPQMQFTKNGKPVLTVAGRAAQATLTAALKKDKAEQAKVLGMAAKGAQAAARGYDEEKKTLTPKYGVVEIDLQTGMPKNVPEDGNYSFPLKNSSRDVQGYNNHHGPTSYEEAIRTAITSGIPIADAEKALRNVGIFPTISTEEAQQGLMGTGGLAPFPGSNPNVPPTGGRRTQSSGPISGLIETYSRKFRLDPAAVRAVALGEGGLSYGAVGDNGTSFGPFQLHVGGALPKGEDASFANSETGIEYAMRKMSEAGAQGLTGPEAIEMIIRKFERPLDPDTSVRNALARYQEMING